MAMDRRARAAPREDEERPSHGRFLRPGALARLRDSRIVARSLRSAAARLPISSAPPSPAPAAASEQQRQDGVPHFLVGPARGLCGAARYPLRRRMAAARCVVFLPPPEAFLDAPAPSWGLVTAR
ncbi:hypothetical protein CFC21_087529 [Triticum aestivum]|uniref:Uncharacterized protein n=3 Tax=Triticum TaxID=4564 RepID=A0A9R1IHG3_WHEAT|nr:hypothetical protein CFC21_087529 [Triticum aestivum]